MGDYGGGNIRNCEPTKGKGFRKTFQRSGYTLFLVNEYNTSKMNFITGLENEKFRLRPNPRPHIKGTYLVHGLLRSPSILNNNSSSKYFLVNRNLNGSMNILIKGKSILFNQPIPDYLVN